MERSTVPVPDPDPDPQLAVLPVTPSTSSAPQRPSALMLFVGHSFARRVHTHACNHNDPASLQHPDKVVRMDTLRLTSLRRTFAGDGVHLNSEGFHRYIQKKRIVDLEDVINAILGSVVAVTAGCAFYEPWESLMVGFLSGMAVVLFFPLYDVLRIDDPVGSFAVHRIGGLSGTLCVGIFIKRDTLLKLVKYNGLIHGGGFYLLGIQALGVLSITVWNALTTFIFLKAENLVIPIRMKSYEEILAADFVEHNIRHAGIDYDVIMKALESPGHVIKEPWCHSIHPELQHQAAMKEWFVNLKTTGRISSATGEVKPSGGSNREEWKDEVGKFYDVEWSVLRSPVASPRK
ncbi:unnamed protein product [Darwinula stevensoni]|uniref:Ammonium transporter AmtB-like domain-containing protein n=1 Tax=Darwinula stevensoni TaxID=69355 RepID=A0A7R9AB51_9CRUS|nr:unnamed protein product [Darwinula stevensoni]CAG0898740.1 unnamed protein product [Darwinula stevensoni]